MTLQTPYDQLSELRLSAFREVLRDQQTNPQYNDLIFEDRPFLLEETEYAQRREKRIRRNIHIANFPMQVCLEDLDFSPSCGLDRRFILKPGQCGWIASHQNVLIFGPTGCGKSYLASAFGVASACNRFSVRYQRTSRLLHTLALARQDCSLSNLMRSLAKTDLLILHDWMRDAITIQNAQDILEVMDDRFGHASTLIASQVPISNWHFRIPNPTLADAILDRIVHNAHHIQLEGESQRKLRAQRSMPNT